MKKIAITLLMSFGALVSAQVIIGGKVGNAPVTNNSVLLQFANTNDKGLVLPTVRTMPTSPTPGTLVVDGTNPNAARVKYYNGKSGDGWQDLSGTNGNVSSLLATQPETVNEKRESKTIIGDQNTSADGILVLESATKAMVLPTVSDVQNVLNPTAGMMVFVNKSGSKRLAVYNGTVWSFWRP